MVLASAWIARTQMHLAPLIGRARKVNLLGSVFGTIIGQVASGGVILAIASDVCNMLKNSEKLHINNGLESEIQQFYHIKLQLKRSSYSSELRYFGFMPMTRVLRPWP